MPTDIKQQRRDAKAEIEQCLSDYGKCAFIRPTGWGKTWTTASFVDDYKKILYLYPSKAIRNTFLYAYYTLKLQAVQEEIPNVILMTYSKLRRLTRDNFKQLKDIDLIIADECDILGAPETMRAMFDLLSYAKNAKLLGATATPERQDMIDEIAVFFDDHLISDYTLRNALEDNIIKKPHYVTCCYDDTAKEILEKFKKKSAMEVDKMAHINDKQEIGAYFAARQLECSNILSMEKTIPSELANAGLDTAYQKYIVFFPSFKMIRKQSRMVRNWFEKAFPNHNIRELTITSESRETHKNVDLLDKLVPEDGVIHLIYTCNMMNMGYHVNTLTGIIMFRGTSSSHIFIQQLGRVLSTGSIRPGIVFDVMGNIHRPAIYQMCWEKKVFPGAVTTDGDTLTDNEIKEYKTLVDKTMRKDENNRPIPLTNKERNRLIKLKRKINKIQTPGNGIAPVFSAEDFEVSSREATVRELIAKSVAEPISMRCRQAWSRWLEKGGDDSIMTKEFILSQKAPEKTPLPPFCRLKHVSVEAVLDEMGVV